MINLTEHKSWGHGRFRLERELGHGAMGIVYEALDTEKKVRVALKGLKCENPEEIYRLKLEFRSLQNVVHPNVCRLGEFFEEDGRWFFVMELIHGLDFLQYCSSLKKDPSSIESAINSAIPPSNLIESVESQLGPHRFCEIRLRKALSGVVQGMIALHAAGIVHRDIKPTNVIVTDEGRAVLLDFGLIIETQNSEESIIEFAGTPAYMAPEQVEAGPVSAAADWYAVGVMLYEALTGMLPFSGPPLKMLLRKQTIIPEPPNTFSDNVPQDLNNLCMDLLRIDPQSRPKAPEIQQRLGQRPEQLISRPAPAPSLNPHEPTQSVFVGRRKELKVLHRGFDDIMKGYGVSVVIEGVSGVGKSALIAQFMREVQSSNPETIFLAGRCYERESVPFKAFDGIVDALMRHLRNLPDIDAANLTPQDAPLLARLFPSLNRVKAIARKPLPRHEIVNPHEMQRRAFRALGDSFLLLSNSKPLVVFIDDMQWTDSDSLLFLKELLRSDYAPPMLFILSSRFTEGDKESFIDWDAEIPGDLIRISLETLSPQDSEDLASQCLKGSRALEDSISPRDIAAEAGGHPLYIAELSHHAMHFGKGGLKQFRLDDVIWNRVQRFPASALLLLTYSCVSGIPLRCGHLRDVALLEEEEFIKDISKLRAYNLIRSRGVLDDDPIEPYHDRVRQAILTMLSQGNQAPQFHLTLGRFLLEKYSSKELTENIFEVVRHLNEGASLIADPQEIQSLSDLNSVAGDKAHAVAAYVSAAQHFMKSIELAPSDRWTSQYEKTLSLYVSCADSTSLMGDFALTTKLVRETLDHAKTSLDRAKILEVQVLSLVTQGKHLEAVNEGIVIAKELGIDLPREPTKIHVLLKISSLKLRLWGKSKQDLLNLPKATDEQTMVARRFFCNIAYALALYFPKAVPIGTVKLIEQSLKYGNDYMSAVGFSAWGYLNTGFLHNYEYGYKMGQISIELLDVFSEKCQAPLTLFIWATTIQHWKNHIGETLPYFVQSAKTAKEIGDITSTGNSLLNHSYHSFFAGAYLPSLNTEFELNEETLRQTSRHTGLNINCVYHQTVLNLMGESENSSILVGVSFDENAMVPLTADPKNQQNLFDYYFNKLFLEYLFGYFEKAVKTSDQLNSYLHWSVGSFANAIYPYYDSLARLSYYSEADPIQRAKLLKQVAKNQKVMKKRAKHAPSNHLHRYHLVKAEIIKLKGNNKRAAECYELAIQEALEHKFVQDAALACELASRFFHSIDDLSKAKKHLEDSHNLYAKWGATAKVDDLRMKNPELLKELLDLERY